MRKFPSLATEPYCVFSVRIVEPVRCRNSTHRDGTVRVRAGTASFAVTEFGKDEARISQGASVECEDAETFVLDAVNRGALVGTHRCTTSGS